MRESIPSRMRTAHSQTIVLAHLRKFEASYRHSMPSFRTEPNVPMAPPTPQQRSCTSSQRSFSPNRTTVSTNIRVVGSLVKELRRSFRANAPALRSLELTTCRRSKQPVPWRLVLEKVSGGRSRRFFVWTCDRRTKLKLEMSFWR